MKYLFRILKISVQRSLIVFFLLYAPIANAQNKSDLALRYLDLFSHYEYLDWDSAKAYLDSAAVVGKDVNDHNLQGKIDLFTGWYYQDLSQFDTSRTCFFKALDHYTLSRNYNKIADVYGNIGNAYLDVGDAKNALEYQLKSLRTNEKILLLTNEAEMQKSAQRGRAYAWTNLANIYKTLGQYEKSKAYELQAVKYELDYGDSIGLAISYVNLGVTYDNLGQLDSAEYYAHLAHNIFKRNEYSTGLINSYINLYKYSKLRGDENPDYLIEAYQYAYEFDDAYSEVYVLGYLISCNRDFSKDSLKRMVVRANELIDDYHLETSLFRFYADQGTYYARQGDYQRAYESMIKYIGHYSDLKEENQGIDFNNAELKHEFELRSLQDSLAFEQAFNEQRLDNEKRIGRQRIITTVTIFGFGILVVVLVFVFRSLRVRKQNNLRLSEKNEQIERQKVLVEEKNKEITDSITYAQRLQQAILPSVELIQQFFKDSFVVYQPKDVVSGDFYWFEQKDDLIFLAAADCTGHGVPGALVSVVCSNALNRSVNEFGMTAPSMILDKTRELVVKTFAKSGKDVKDGMDICLCVFNSKQEKLSYAGAYNPLWIVRQNEYLTSDELEAKSTQKGKDFSLIEISASKQPVGLFENMDSFQQTELKVCPRDQFYLFTDGYADQFGGEKGKKLKYKKFKMLILENADRSHVDQNQNLEAFMQNWKRDFEQVDDICVIGVRMK